MVEIDQFAPGDVPFERWKSLGEMPYYDDPKWIPPFDSDIRQDISSKHSFLKHGRVRFFIARDGQRDEARVMAAIDQQMQTGVEGEVVGTLGFFEMVGLESAYEVLEEALLWLKREGVTTVWGPMNRSIWHGYRFRTRGFHISPFYGEPYNPPDYPRFFEDFGFQTAKQYRTVELEPGEGLRERLKIDLKLLKKLEDRGYQFRNLELANFDSELKKIHALIMDSYQAFFGFTSIQYEEFYELYSGLKSFVEDGLVITIFDKADEMIGVLFSMPDLSEGIRAMQGKSNWLGKLRYLWNKQDAERVVVLFAGLTRRAMRLGVPAGVGASLHTRILERGFKRVSHALMAEGLEEFWQRWETDARGEDVVEYKLYRFNLREE